MRRKITVVGAGNVGATCAQELARRDYADVVLVDIIPKYAAGKALDMNQAGSVLGYEPKVVGTESYDRCMAVNSRGTFFLTQAFARRLVSEPAGLWHRAIVFVTSVNAADVVPVTRGEYGMSKAAASMAVRLFAARLAPEGIGVYEVRPGVIENVPVGST